MNPVLALLLAPLVLGALLALRATLRERDLRLGTLLLALVLLAMRHVASPPPPLEALQSAGDALTTPVLVDLAANLAALLAVLLAARTLHERNRSEQVQWRSMEALRRLVAKLREARGPLDRHLDELLALGSEIFALETAFVAAAAGDERTIEVIAVRAPDDVALETGGSPALADTLAARTLATDGIVAVECASHGHWSLHPAKTPYGWESFLGVRVGPSHALCFASRSEHPERFGDVDRSLLLIIAEWLAPRLVAEETADARAQEREKPLVRAPDRDAAPGLEEATPAPDDRLDPNAVVERLQRPLEEALGDGRWIRFEPATDLPPIGLDPQLFERIATTLVQHAGEAGPSGGEIRIETAQIGGVGASEGGGDGTGAFVTLSVCARGPGLGTDALAALYEGRGDWAVATGGARLPLTRVVRLLRQVGGDLSLESEEGVGTTLTAYFASPA